MTGSITFRATVMNSRVALIRETDTQCVISEMELPDATVLLKQMQTAVAVARVWDRLSKEMEVAV